MIKRLLCALSLHALSVTQVASIDVAKCKHCKKSWAVDTRTQEVFKI